MTSRREAGLVKVFEDKQPGCVSAGLRDELWHSAVLPTAARIFEIPPLFDRVGAQLSLVRCVAVPPPRVIHFRWGGYMLDHDAQWTTAAYVDAINRAIAAPQRLNVRQVEDFAAC